MNHPFWIINASLLLLLFLAHLSIRFLQPVIPVREPIIQKTKPLQEKMVHVNLEKIYKNDLFNTIKSVEPLEVAPEPLPVLPRLPKVSLPTTPPTPPEPRFLDPLNITLKGIFFVGAHKKENSVIFQNNTTNEEITASVGTKVQDAVVVRIFKNKVLLLRVNGQQEILYLREEDAKLDSAYGYSDDWNDVITKIDNNTYQISIQEFMIRVANMGQLLYTLGVTTAYKNGKSIGCRIGVLDQGNVGIFLGLKTGDIITKINEKPVFTTKERLEIFKEISEQKKETLTVKILRNGQDLSMKYILKNMLTMPLPLNKDSSKNPTLLEKRDMLQDTQNYLKNREYTMLKKKQRKGSSK